MDHSLAVSVAVLPQNVRPQDFRALFQRYGVSLLIILAAAAYYPRFVKLPAGMETYPQAASCLWHGQMLQTCDQGFTYPPFFALVMLPFAPMPLWLRDVVWYGATLAATIGVFRLSEDLICKSFAAPLARADRRQSGGRAIRLQGRRQYSQSFAARRGGAQCR